MFFHLELSRLYGVNGGDPKRVDTKSIIFDFSILQHMQDPSFINNLKSKADDFLKELISLKESGNKNIHTKSLCLFYSFFV